MDDQIEQLTEAYKTKEEIEGFLANLEKLNSEGSVTEEQYSSIRKDYYRRLGTASSEIAGIKNELNKQLQANEHEIETCKQKLSALAVKQKVGELSAEQYQESERELQSELHRLERKGEELNRLIQVGCLADISAPAKPRVSPPPEPTTSADTPPAQAEAKDKAATPLAKIKLPRVKLLTAVGGALVVVVVVILVVLFAIPGEKNGTIPVTGGTETVTIPVDIVGAAGIGSLGFELVYDYTVINVVEVEGGTLLNDALIDYDNSAPGRLMVAMVSSNGISGDGTIVTITFQIGGEPGQSIPLYLENIAAYDAVDLSRIQLSATAGSYTPDSTPLAPVISFQGTAGN